MLKNYNIYTASSPGCLEEEWDQCLKQITDTRKSGQRVLKLNIFVNVSDHEALTGVRNNISGSLTDTFGDELPAYNISAHPPEQPFNVVVEGLFIHRDIASAVTRFCNSRPYVVVSDGNALEVWAAGLGSDDYRYDTEKAARAAFEKVSEVLKRENLSFNNLVRQWNYIGNIIDVKDGFQNYQVFNEVRSEYYKRYRDITIFPSATGVGMKTEGVILDFCAVKLPETAIIRAISNPEQIDAYQYDQRVLAGNTGEKRPVKNPPLFERALIIPNVTFSTLFISGTASILGQNTVGKGDIKKQIITTIENIKSFTVEERIKEVSGKTELNPGEMKLLRVYVKNKDDFSGARKACERYFPGVKAVFIEADICRDDLLIEIEAEMLI
jgi:enamine deaminase RidA (YjgF/YER057c/UK114 family)